MSPHKPGDAVFDPATGKLKIWNGATWVPVEQPDPLEDLFRLSPTDKVMKRLEDKVTADPNLPNMTWHPENQVNSSTYDISTWPGGTTRSATRKGNEPDFWLGIAYGMYQNGKLDKQEMMDILLALKGAGAESDYVGVIYKSITQP